MFLPHIAGKVMPVFLSYQYQTETSHTHIHPISLMNTGERVLNKILANNIQQHIKKIVYHDHMRFMEVCKVGSLYESQSTLCHFKTIKQITHLPEEKAFP